MIRAALAGAWCLVLVGGSPLALVHTAPASQDTCVAELEDTPGLTWEYVPPDFGSPGLLCTTDEIAALFDAANGNWGLAVRDFNTGETLLANPDKSFVAGSLYKLGVAAEAYARIDAGTLGKTSWVSIGPQDVDVEYGGSSYDAGTYLTVEQAVESMLTASDNGAALALLDRLGLNAVNERFGSLGMPGTRLIYDAETTPRDLLTYFSLLADGELISPKVSERLVHLLAAQRINDRIPAGLPADEEWWVAHKTGNVDSMVGDAGLVYTSRGVFALVLITQNFTTYQKSVQTIRAVSQRVYRSLVALSPDTDELVVDPSWTARSRQPVATSGMPIG